MSKPIVTVFGATGEQGGSVVNYLLQDGGYTVRGVTRKPTEEKALALAKRGVEVVAGDLADVASIAKVTEGAEFVFVVTQAWEHFDKELQHGLNAIKALTGSTSLKQVIFSGLEDPKEFEVPHFRFKAEIEEAFKATTLPWTFVHAGFYFENFLTSVLPQKHGEVLAYALPTGTDKFGMVSVKEYGGFVVNVIKNYQQYLHKTVLAVADYLTLQQVIVLFAEATGLTIVDAQVTIEQFAQFPFPGAKEIAVMFGFLRKYQPYKDADVEARKIFPQVSTLRAWAKTSGLIEKLKSL